MSFFASVGVLLAAVVISILFGLFERKIGELATAHISWFQALLILSGGIAFAGGSSETILPLRLMAGLFIAFMGGGLLLRNYLRETTASIGSKHGNFTKRVSSIKARMLNRS